MKLYREVPPEKGTGLSLHEFKGDWAEPTYKCSLESIEITKKEIEEILNEYSNTDLQTVLSMHGRCYIIDPMDYHKIVMAILSKLKGK